MTQVGREAVFKWVDLITKVGTPTALLVVVLYFVRSDLIVPMVETTRTLAVAYDKLAGAMETQTMLIREFRDEQRRTGS